MPKRSQPSAAESSRARRPALLVSFVYLESFIQWKAKIHYRDWVMDSGAFSAFNSGMPIDLNRYIETAKHLLRTDPTLTEVFALDVIGDWRASLKNCERMWNAGVPATPCYHVGEPDDVLTSIARDYPRIALGGAVGFRQKQKWALQCVAKVWPKRIHGFGFGSRKDILAIPFNSVDATNWEIGPKKFGRWITYGRMSVRGGKNDLATEIASYMEIERLAQHRWGPTFAAFPRDPGKPRNKSAPPTVRLAWNDARRLVASQANPSVRLAWNNRLTKENLKSCTSS